MFRIDRESKPTQLASTNEAYLSKIEGYDVAKAYKYYNDNRSKYKYNTEETKNAFYRMSFGRCSFCSKCISDFFDEMTVEHIELKKEKPNKIFEWNNLLCACRSCNTKRSIKKYIDDRYLDPTKIIDIDRYFKYNLDGSIEANNCLSSEEVKKVEYMIELYELDRVDLRKRRRSFIQDIIEDEEFSEILKTKNKYNEHIIFLSVFTYYIKE